MNAERRPNDFLALIEAYDAAGDAERQRLERELWDRFGVEKTVVVLDMAQFTRSVKRFGIVRFLARIARMRRIVREAVAAHAGTLIKFDADNAFIVFDRSRAAIDAALAINRNCADCNRPADDAIQVCIGIARGPLLVVEGGTDLYGDCVNVAAKLGEDIAGPGEILMTAEVGREVIGETAAEAVVALEEARFDVAAVSISGFRVIR